MVDCESSHERNFLLLCDLDPNVTEVYSQPFEWRGWLLNANRVHYPDFAIVVEGRGEVHEVKTIEELRKKEKHEVRLGWTEWAEEQGIPYSVVTEGSITADLIKRAETLLRYAKPIFEDIAALHVATALEAGPLTIDSLLGKMASHDLQFHQVLSMAYNERVFIDLSTDVSRHSVIRYPDRGNLPPRIVPFTRLTTLEDM
ncbi:hypothetical protein GCM10010990_02050 [Croceicoccus mobilis]|uniref:TnsA endonuclease N-terminal domain-containing protein n=2 Tax=Croceicoccus mobilis TaxID=1703339 RepID=A0A917DQC2_9SPHN|nr:hypothetical protein GCM10010990_02050 [Croceicoccus mobilis]